MTSKLDNYDIAVLLPCYNEGPSIAEVVLDFRRYLPSTRIYVYDNNSVDDTAEQAARAGATVIPSRRQGKGNVVRQMFSDIDADIYIMADGDGTYDASSAPKLIEALIDDRLDMVVGTRHRIFNIIFRAVFGNDFSDIFSGYRVFTRRFAKSFPAQSPGFEIETELSVHASVLRLPIKEIECDYGRRIEGSESKLSSFRDGFKILRMIAMLMKETRPFTFFSYIALILGGISAVFMTPVLIEYFATGLVNKIPTWILSMTLMISAIIVFSAGVILDSVARGRAEQKRVHYLSISPSRGERSPISAVPIKERRENAAQRGKRP